MDISKKPVTIKTLAQILGLTPATISKALRDEPDISAKTRRLVKQKADELGYAPNIMARSLIKRRSHLLGVIVPDLAYTFFTRVLKGIFARARALNYEPIVMIHEESSRIEKRNLGFLAALNVDGILIASVPGTKNNSLIKRISENGIPFVCFDRIVDSLDFCSVTINDEAATFELVEFITKMDRRHIVFLGPTQGLYVARGRFKGYCRALKYLDIEQKPEFVLECNANTEDAELKIRQLINSQVHFNAVIATGGLVAFGAGRAILDAGLAMPDDVIIAEFGNNDLVHRLARPFISVEQFPEKMGQKAVELIVDIIENKGKDQPKYHVVIETKLIVHHVKGSNS